MPVILDRISELSGDVLTWNTGPGVVLTDVAGGRDAVVTGAGPGVVTVEVVRGAGAGLADVPPGEGPGPPEAGAWLPAGSVGGPSAGERVEGDE